MKYKILALSIGILTLYGCKDTENQSQKPFGMQNPTISYINIKKEDIPLIERYKGKIEPFIMAEIRPQVSGIIINKNFKDGEYVKKDQILYKINPEQYKATYNQSLAILNSLKAELESAKAKYERYNELFKVKAISKEEKESAEANYKKLLANIEEKKANLNISKINLEYTDIKSPINGIAGISTITEGSLVTANQSEKINTIVNLDKVYIDINQTAEQFLKMKETIKRTNIKNPEIKVLDLNNYTGKIISNDILVDSNTNNIKIRSEVDNHDKSLLPGMYVNTEINYGVEKNLIKIPQSSVTFNVKGNPFVFKIKEENDKKIIEKVEVKLINSIKNYWIIEGNLNNNDKVVVEGLDKIRDGSIVNAEEFKGKE